MTELNAEERKAAWPTRDILLFGSFGSGTPDARRFRSRGLSALGLAVTCGVVLAWLQPAAPVRLPLNALLALPFGYLAWEWWRYITHLDELARRLQVEAMAWTYMIGICAAMALAWLCGLLNWKFNPAFFVLLEPVRAVRLWVLCRRF